MTSEEILKACCWSQPEPPRFAVEHPWVERGYWWATDGRICARMPTREPDTVFKSAKQPPRAQHLPQWTKKVVATAAMPNLSNIAERIACAEPECAEKPYRACQECGGSGTVNNGREVVVYQNELLVCCLAAHYAKRLERFGIKELDVLEGGECVRCRVDDVEIVLMGVASK